MKYPLASTLGERGELFLQTADDFHRQRLRVNKRLNTLRRKLNIITKDTKNYSQKNKISRIDSEDYDKDTMFGDVILFQAERDLLHAQETKLLLDVHFSHSKELFINSKYRKAWKSIQHLISIMEHEKDLLKLLEVLTYGNLIKGLSKVTMKRYTEAYPIFNIAKESLLFLYSHQELDSKYTKELYLDIIDLTIEPALKVVEGQCASEQSFSLSELTDKTGSDKFTAMAVKLMQKIDPSFVAKTDNHATKIRQISWSRYTVDVEREEVALAISKIMGATENILPFDFNSYDQSLILYQDAINLQSSEIERNGKDIYDSENQDQFIILTYLKYNYLLLTIRRDFAMIDKLGKDLNTGMNTSKQKTLSLLREILKVNDSILDSLNQINELPGVSNDDTLVDYIQTLHSFFTVKKQIRLAQAYIFSNKYLQSLALATSSFEILNNLKPFNLSSEGNLPVNDDIHSLKAEVEEMISKLYMLASYFSRDEKYRCIGSKYIVDNFDKVPKYSPNELIKNIAPLGVTFEPVNVKPVLFDIAFNYIGYDDAADMEEDTTEQSSGIGTEEEKKKGFFGLFGR